MDLKKEDNPKTELQSYFDMDLKLLNVTDIALFLGVSKNTIYYWVNQKQIPFYKIGKHLRFQIADILSWSYSNIKDEVDSQDEILSSLKIEGAQNNNHNLEDPFS